MKKKTSQFLTPDSLRKRMKRRKPGAAAPPLSEWQLELVVAIFGRGRQASPPKPVRSPGYEKLREALREVLAAPVTLEP